jgi:hypothetical protein
MLQLSTAGEHRQLDVKSIVLSQSRAQIERRNHFDQVALAELAESIKKQGVVVPIIVRPTKPFDVIQDAAPNTSWSIWRREGSRNKHGDPVVERCATRDEAETKLLELVADSDTFELIAGERRLHAARKAGLSQIPAIVRHATDSQAHEIQLIENLQREDLSELAEAEGYEDKAIDKILVPHEFRKDPMTFREAQTYVHDEFTLKLSSAPFSKDDETLVPGAGTCGKCPKRTGNQPADLFGDIKSADVCTDPVCFKDKRSAHMKRELEKAKETGQKVIRGAEAKRILPGQWDHTRNLRNGYVRPSDKCDADPKKRTYAELAGKDAPRQLLQNPDSGKVSAVFSLEEITDKLKDKGIKLDKPAKDQAQRSERDHAAEQARRELDAQVRVKVFAAICKAAPAKLERETLEQLVALRFDSNPQDVEEIFNAFEWPEKKFTYNNVSTLVLEQLAKLSDAELNRLARASLVASDVFDSYGDRKELNALAKEFGVDQKKIRDEIEGTTAPAGEEPKPAKASAKPKAAKKKKKAAKKK